MKKLLLLNNLLLILSIGKCAADRTTKATDMQPVPDSLSAVTRSIVLDSFGDTIGVAYLPIDSITHDSLNNNMSKEDKYKARPHNPKEAPKHNAPDQAKIDSIKQAKDKDKK